MAISFPVPATDFFSSIGQVSATFDLSAAVEVGETGGGEVTTADYGPRLWGGTVVVRPWYHDDMDRIMALARRLLDPGASLFVTPVWRAGPIGGVPVTGTPQITLVGDNARDVRIAGLPSNYTLRAGSYLSFTYQSGGVDRFGFHQIVADRSAGGGGTATLVELSPRVRPGLSIPTDVALVAPQCKAKVVPGSMQGPTYVPLFGQGLTFAWRQTLK